MTETVESAIPPVANKNFTGPNAAFLDTAAIEADPLLRMALIFADGAHRDKDGKRIIRRDGSEYIEHLVLTCNLLDKFTREDFLHFVGLNQDGQINGKARGKFGALLEAVGHENATEIDEEVYQDIKVLLKAVALLHDVLEDKKTYSLTKTDGNRYQRFDQQFSMVMKQVMAERDENGEPKYPKLLDWHERQHIKVWMDYVYGGIAELTDDEKDKRENKRNRQVDHASDILPEFRLIKMLDQGSTIVGDILNMDLTNLKAAKDDVARNKALEPLKKNIKFAHKGVDVSWACSKSNDSENPESNPFYQFVKRTSEFYQNSVTHAEEGRYDEAEKRKQKYAIQIYPVVKISQDTRRAPRNPPRVNAQQVDNPKGYPTKGITSIKVMGHGRKATVVGYTAVIHPNATEDEKDITNETLAALREKLERHRLEDYSHVYVRTESLPVTPLPKTSAIKAFLQIKQKPGERNFSLGLV